MTKIRKRVQIALPPLSEWEEFLKEFFAETPVEIHVSRDIVQTSRDFDRLRPDVLFYTPEFLTLSLVQKWKAHRALAPQCRFFQLGDTGKSKAEEFKPEAIFLAGIHLLDFQGEIAKHLPFAENIHVLVTDDEKEIGIMIRDYLSYHAVPAFRVDYCENGAIALEYLEKNNPDILVMDVKMPVMGGIEVYRLLQEAGSELPVIIFFDAVFGDEVEKIQKLGHPAIIEKGGRQSEMPALLALIKKKVFFG